MIDSTFLSVTEAAPTSAVHSTTEATFPLSTGKIANEVIDTTSSKTGTADKNNVITRKHPEKDCNYYDVSFFNCRHFSSKEFQSTSLLRRAT